jgi:hypothetical protein
MEEPKKPTPAAPSDQEELEIEIPREDDVSVVDKELRALQSGLGQLVHRLELVAIKAATLTAPGPRFAGFEALEPALAAAQKCRTDLAVAQSGLIAAEEQWQAQRD